ncbi:uncharacterized mitochondrial protein-like protein [Tanacetum coccineum]
MVVGESSQPPVKDTTLTFQCPILTSTNYTIWRMRMEVLLGIYGEAIKTRNLGADRVKEAKLQTLITEFENLKMLDNGTIDEYASKLSGIASKSATLGEVMSEHKLVKKFLISLPRRFVYIVASLEQVSNHKTTGFEDVVGRLKAYEERVKKEDKANDPQENLLYARTEYSNGNNDSSEGRGRGLYSRGRGRDNEQKGKQQEKRDLSHIQCYHCDQYGYFVSKCPERNRNHEVNLNETQEKGVYHEEGTFFMMNHIQEMIFINEEKYTPPKSESNTGEDDVWYFDNGASNHMTESEEDHSRSDDTPIPIVRLETIRLLIALVAGKGWKIHHLEVKTDFINGDRKKLDSTLKEMGFLQCVREKAVYRKVPNGEFIIVTVNVDDLFVTGTSLDLINKFKRRMASQFEMSDLEAGMEDCNATSYPMEKDLKLSKAEDEPEVEATQYQKVVGCLRYLLHTRPYLTYSVGVVSRYMQSLRESHARAIKQILRYLKGTTSFGIKYNRSNDMKLVGYSDSSHNVDIDDGRSTTGHVFYLGTSPITWCSQKKTIVALSSCEAEFMAATAVACQAIWLRELLAEVTGLERQKVIIRVDNKSAVALSKNSTFHGRSKHIHKPHVRKVLSVYISGRAHHPKGT